MWQRLENIKKQGCRGVLDTEWIMEKKMTAQPTNESKLLPIIFVVDDWPAMLELTGTLLNSAGYQTRVFSNPLDVLSSLNSAEPKPRLLITDFHMPHLNGMELIQRCKAIIPDLKVISTSGSSVEETLSLYQEKPDMMLSKPFSGAELLRLVGKLLEEE
jgi:DNA-binding NtrC family response regulator